MSKPPRSAAPSPDAPLPDAPGERTPDTLTPVAKATAEVIAAEQVDQAQAATDEAASEVAETEIWSGVMQDRIREAGGHYDRESGYRTRSPDPAVSATDLDAAATAMFDAAATRLSPPAAGPIPAPLPAVRPFGTTAKDAPPAVALDPLFDRRSTIDALLTHPSAEVRQRAEEARAALHHGAPDAGLKMRAAIDTAKVSEATR